jgi:hypothetical protein
MHKGSPEKRPFTSHYEGVRTIAQRNARKSYVIPSTKNFVEIYHPSTFKFQIRDMKIDTGASCSLLYFNTTNDLMVLLQNALSQEVSSASRGLHHYRVDRSESPGGQFLVLSVSSAYSYGINLGQDIFPESAPVDVDKISFHLCSEDINALLDKSNEAIVPPSIRTQLFSIFTSGVPVIPRRRWALLGDDVLSQVQMIKVDKLIFLIDMQKHTFPGWKEMLFIEKEFLACAYLNIHNPDSDELHAISDELIDVDPDFSDFM